MKRNVKQMLTVLTLGCFMMTGCTAAGSDMQNQNPQSDGNENVVYRFTPSSRTTNQWENVYGVISHDGKIIIPVDTHEVYIIKDSATDEQLWIQTTTRTVDDPNLTAEELWEADNWEKLHYNYTLYDLDGNLIKSLGENGISKVYGNLILYHNGQLKDKDTGEVYFEDVNTINDTGSYYVMNTRDYNHVRVTDENLNILYETRGGFISINGDYYISAEIEQEDGTRLRGLQKLDGTQIIPCEYEYYFSGELLDVPYVKALRDNREFVISMADGKIMYQESNVFPEYDYIQYLLKDCMVIQKREKIATAENGGWPIYNYYTALYDYEGNQISDKYSYLAPQMSLYNNAMAQGKEPEMLFSATKLDGTELIINQNEEVLFTLEDGWMTLVNTDRIILHDYENNSAQLCDLNGTQMTERDYNYMYTMYLESLAGEYINSKLISASYTISGRTLYDLLDSDGNVLIERAKSIQGLSEDRFWVEKGFSQGLMDLQGNWLYEQSVFDSAIDE